jgi:DNA invertase Pin-like site-specific DNA recombinase
MSKRVAIYARVSTDGQTTDNQLLELRKVAKHMGWSIQQEYVDHGISGAKGRDKRPEFNQLLKNAVQRKFDVIMVWSVDRLGRSLQDLVSFLSEVHTTGIDLLIHQQGIDTTTPAGKAMFQMLGVFAEFERSMIRERVLAGQARARQQGKKIGRPKVDSAKEEAIRQLRGEGCGIRKIAKELSVGVSVVQRVVA